jgi:anaerobic magnesium-protoporphyrin IX monomethyl ester cyclase
MNNPFRVLFVYPNLMMSALILPAGISILSAVLKKRGFQTRLFDTTFYKTQEKGIDEIRMGLLQLRKFSLNDQGIQLKTTDVFEDLDRTVREYQPDLIALTATEDVYPQGMALIKSIQRYGIPTVVGGVYAFFSAEEVLLEEGVNYVVCGEGEEALAELCEALRDKQDPSGIQNLWSKDRQGKIIRNPMRPPVDLDALPPPDYDIFEPARMVRPMQGKLYRMIPVEVQRGCPYTCSYCEAPSILTKYKKEIGARYLRTKNMKHLMEEIRYLINRYNGNYLYLNAETFLAMTDDEFHAFIEGYRSIKLPFWMETRPETITEKRMQSLKDVGLHHMNVGIEHGNQEFRQRMLHRAVTNKKMLEGLEILDKLNVGVTVNNIIGFPEETRELIFDTINLNRQIKSATINAYIFQPYKGSVLYELCKAKGYLPQDWKTKAFFGTVLKMPQISAEELVGLQRTFCLYAEMPLSYEPEIRVAERLDEEGNRKFEELKNIYYKMKEDRALDATKLARTHY